MEVFLGRVSVGMSIKPPVHIVAINIMKRVHIPLAPLDIESSNVGGIDPIEKLNVELSRRHDIIIVRCLN